VAKERFGEVVRRARLRYGLSLREAAARAELDYTRLSRIENGSRPAPGMNQIRLLADLLHLDLVDLVAAAGVSREVMESLAWSERLWFGCNDPHARTYSPHGSALRMKNTFAVRVEERDGALCRVRLGDACLTVVSFSGDEHLLIEIPPEAVVVHQGKPKERWGSAENVLRAEVRKCRRLGQVVNLVLSCAGFELNTLHSERGLSDMGVEKGDKVVAAVQATAIRTSPLEEETKR
jgi:transcriptional regulator with XRE-family HTH domain